MPEINWDSELYTKQHHFVSDYGADVLQWLAPQSGEHILDVGCGTGELTAKIAESGAIVLGTDSSEEMVTASKRNFPELEFEVIDGTQLPYLENFDAVFSNATFHWIDNQKALTIGLYHSLKKGGRLVTEFGGKGNIKSIIDAVGQAAQQLGLESKLNKDFWFFPSIADYTTLLEKNGFEVEQAWLFHRPTPLNGENGMHDWITQFAPYAFKNLEGKSAVAIQNLAVDLLKSTHYVNHQWMADYKRLRIKAFKR
ncbi:MAG: methyltransferase domain-containing protein [Pedobacter sp.]|nr:methyltransferase domain-containing protein [Pedobacter sp.]MDQ8053919.1 methyltransferase domain-containing protein [Pedobacter sp.]